MGILLERMDVIRPLPVPETPTVTKIYAPVHIQKIRGPITKEQAKLRALGFSHIARTEPRRNTITPDLNTTEIFYLSFKTQEVKGYHCVEPNETFLPRDSDHPLAINNQPLSNPSDSWNHIISRTQSHRLHRRQITPHPFTEGTRFHLVWNPKQPNEQERTANLTIREPYNIKETIAPAHETTRILATSAYFYIILLFSLMYNSLNREYHKQPIRRSHQVI